MVIRGDYAEYGIDYFETFSPVAKIESVRIVFAIIITHKLIPRQYDVDNAFVQSEIAEDVYMKSIPGYPLPPGKCYKLRMSLYGMPQASRNWNSAATTWLVDVMGFTQLREDLCLFALFIDGLLVGVAALYVDDLIAGFDSEERAEWFEKHFDARFRTKKIGLPSNVLGLKILWETIPGELYFKSVKIMNIKSINQLLIEHDMEQCTHVALPYNDSTRLGKSQCPDDDTRADVACQTMQKEYRRLVGTLLWIYTTVRVDLAYIMLILCSFVANPGFEHYKAAIWVLRYLAGTKEKGITYSLGKDLHLDGYVDADHASHEERRSIYCFIFTLAGGVISWKNGFETRFTLSTAESEIRAVYALREAIKHCLYLKKVFQALSLPGVANEATIAMSELPQRIYEDNAAAIRYSLNASSNSAMKYLETDLYWIHDSIKRKEFVLIKCKGILEQLADIGTKQFKAVAFIPLRDRVFDVVPPEEEISGSDQKTKG